MISLNEALTLCGYPPGHSQRPEVYAFADKECRAGKIDGAQATRHSAWRIPRESLTQLRLAILYRPAPVWHRVVAAAALLNVSTQALSKACAEGSIPRRKVGGRYEIPDWYVQRRIVTVEAVKPIRRQKV